MNAYLEKYGFRDPQILDKPAADLGIVVVIPVYNESSLITSLQSLKECKGYDCSVEVICVINAAENESEMVREQNRQTLHETIDWAANNSDGKMKFRIIEETQLPKKHAGVGLARKIGMDEAVARFDQIHQDGIIVCFDADSLCEQNYLFEIEKLFHECPKAPGCAIHFEHPTSGTSYEKEVYEGIINYELHLRYYKEAMAYCGLPYAFHTVGSSMAVRSSAYQKQGGMNKRKAGEDFYFLHKIISLGNFENLHTTKVIPSPRSSDRVPFGTGRAIEEWLDDSKVEMTTYNFKNFQCIKQFVAAIPDFYQEEYDGIPMELKEFVDKNKMKDAVKNAKSNSKNYDSFKKRFLVWFDAFQFLKCVHFLRDHHFPDELISQESQNLLEALHVGEQNTTVEELLTIYRDLEKR